MILFIQEEKKTRSTFEYSFFFPQDMKSHRKKNVKKKSKVFRNTLNLNSKNNVAQDFLRDLHTCFSSHFTLC